MVGIQQLTLVQFRNYIQKEFHFTNRIVGIVGPNGVGKTNVLDALYYLSFTKSYFSRPDAQNVLSILFLAAFSVYRIIKGCDNLLTGLASIILGIAVGGCLLMLNIKVFGRDSVNFTGLPLLVDRISTGQPLYVCTNQE